MYIWRKLTAEQREELLRHRISLKYPWHGPPTTFHAGRFHVSAACYEHQPYIGVSVRRIESFSSHLLETLETSRSTIFAWCVLPNHYHILIETANLANLKRRIGQLHGRSSHKWNAEDGSPRRVVWHRSSDRAMRNTRHFWVTMNYIHHNPVRHGYVTRWLDWPFSSASGFLASVGMDRALEIWKDYPIRKYGGGWDDPEM